ncbi:hypothetical protein KSD_52030 [Ktedonobacter sp. SOSP1-85]|uniref:trypsin-like peptidase domain-containing protein n=1 Tax=Ktedonobacter sp. SOSP1-85 TaxID=2778367 RepID=UPI001915ECA1|nr:trypsin-like peptidase domain-containing protein [Ktedonobacter sp. SOSP1-85]GHO77432.1 hypothetical protein KSD_52030 [Ktedonobacter sp. SOSP1-85]
MAMQQALRNLLRACTVSLSVQGGGRGTGFFVAPGRILTCAHVVEAARRRGLPISAFNCKGESLGMVQIERYECDVIQNIQVLKDRQASELYPDLALLRIEPEDHPCVFLDARPEQMHTHDELYGYGYDELRFKGGGEVTFKFEGFSWIDEQRYLLKLREGQAQPGLSGAPLIHVGSGGVCGVMQQRRGTQGEIGGWAIPASTVLGVMPELTEAQQHQNTRWQQALSGEPQAKGKRPVRIVDICSNAKRDLALREALLTHTALLRKNRDLVSWHNQEIAPGQDVSQEVRAQLEQADMTLLLLSPNFFTTEIDELVELAMQRANPPLVRVIPILLRPVDDWKREKFGGLQYLPRELTDRGEHKCINSASNDLVLMQVARELRQVAEAIQATFG